MRSHPSMDLDNCLIRNKDGKKIKACIGDFVRFKSNIIDVDETVEIVNIFRTELKHFNSDVFIVTKKANADIVAIKFFIDWCEDHNIDYRDYCVFSNMCKAIYLIDKNEDINKCSCGKICKPADNGECYDCWNKKHLIKFL